MLEDQYRTALVEILRKKQAQLPPHVAPVNPSTENVVSLVDALRRSLASAEHPVASPRFSDDQTNDRQALPHVFS
jgi:DNA end-binding protein Ku